MPTVNPYYGRKVAREAANARRVQEIYRDLDNQRWLQDQMANLQGPFKDRNFQLPVPEKTSREVWRSPHINDIRKPVPMRPEDYDAKNTINVPKVNPKKNYRAKAGLGILPNIPNMRVGLKPFLLGEKLGMLSNGWMMSGVILWLVHILF